MVVVGDEVCAGEEMTHGVIVSYIIWREWW